MTGITLTSQQQKLLDFIKGHIDCHSQAPSLKQMAAAMELGSRSSAHRLLLCLEDRGAIRRLRNKPRALQVVDPAAVDRNNAAVALAALKQVSAMTGALVASYRFLAELRDELLHDLCAANSNLDRSTMDASDAAYVAAVEVVIAQIDAALPDGVPHA